MTRSARRNTGASTNWPSYTKTPWMIHRHTKSMTWDLKITILRSTFTQLITRVEDEICSGKALHIIMVACWQSSLNNKTTIVKLLQVERYIKQPDIKGILKSLHKFSMYSGPCLAGSCLPSLPFHEIWRLQASPWPMQCVRLAERRLRLKWECERDEWHTWK